jgi:hypothetical protein
MPQESSRMPGFSAEDVASMTAVLSMLENEAAKLSADSNMGAVWSNWIELLRPTADELQGATALRVPAPFARALLDDLREPSDDSERENITDPEQLEYEAEIDAAVRMWVEEIDGEGNRILIVASSGPSRRWLTDYLSGAALEGLTGRLEDGSPVERLAAVEALAGWIDVMGQLEEAVMTR